jgi:hypothetical protein
MKNLFNLNDREQLIRRIETLEPTNKRNWGRMTIHQILVHLSDPFRHSLGEKHAIDQNNAVFQSFFGKCMVRFIPWPKAAPTAGEFLPGFGMTEPIDFNSDKQSLLLLIHRFVNVPPDFRFHPHPLFGPLSRKDFGRLYWRHLDHHLRQFSA